MPFKVKMPDGDSTYAKSMKTIKALTESIAPMCKDVPKFEAENPGGIGGNVTYQALHDALHGKN